MHYHTNLEEICNIPTLKNFFFFDPKKFSWQTLLAAIWNFRWIHFFMECTFFLKRFFIGLIPLGKNCPYSEFSGLFFPAFGLNAEIYSVNLQVQYECGKIRTRKNFVSMKKIDSLKKLDQVLVIRVRTTLYK